GEERKTLDESGRNNHQYLAVIGAALGIGMLAKGSVESVARQPESAGTIQVLMIIAAALIEGLAFFAVIVCNA
ncbi:MAG: ATP synthase F0 subunit C, partial [Planctomycetota bacterium]